MEQLFVDRLSSEPRLRLWADTVADIAMTAAREHWHTLLLDAKHGIRVFASQPAFTIVAVLVMAVGIASCVSVFSITNAVLFRSLPYAQPEQLVYLWSPNRNFKGVPDEIGPNLPDFVEWQSHSHSFSAMAGFSRKEINLVGNGSSARVGAAAVGGSFFATLGVSARLGRVLGSGDDQPGSGRAVVISDALWRSRFGSRPSIIGQIIQLNRTKYTVVGVMPPEFGFPFEADIPYERSDFSQTDLWLPSVFTLREKADRTNSGLSLDAIARVRPGVSLAHAQNELIAIQARLDPLYSPMWRGFSALVRPLIQTIVGPIREMFWILLSAVALVLLIAIANTANLLLARTTARAHELGMRAALGADRGRIIRQLLTESLMLSTGAGVLGITCSYALVHLLVRLNPGGISRFETATVDIRALMFAVLLSLFAGALAGLAPALFARRVNVNVLLRNGGRGVVGGAAKGRAVLIATEVALSVVLLAASGLLIRSYLKLAGTDPGFSPATLTFRLDLDERYNTPAQSSRFYRDILKKFRAIPGVSHAGESNGIPLTSWESVDAVEIEGVGPTKEMIEQRSITPDYRQALGVSLVRGRDFSEYDVASRVRVALVNQQFALTYLRGRDPIGSLIRMGIGNLSGAPWSTIVGVVGNMAHNSLQDRKQPQIFLPAAEGNHFAIACRAPSDQIASQVRVVLHSFDPALTIADIRTMGQRITASNARRTFETTLLTGFSCIAVGFALAGLFGLISYVVRQRTAEIGVRLALGSSRGAIMRLFLLQGLRVTLAGLAAGIGVALALTNLLSNWLFGVKAVDPATFIAVPVAMIVVACGGCMLPAWSAMRVDPVQALRNE